MDDIELLQLAITLLIGAVVMLCCYVLLTPMPDVKGNEPSCPLHRCPPSLCTRYHKDEE